MEFLRSATRASSRLIQLVAVGMVIGYGHLAHAQAPLMVFAFRGGQTAFEGLCEGYIRRQLGWLDVNGRPLPIPAAQRIVMAVRTPNGAVEFGVNAGFVSNPAGAPVANARAYDLEKVPLIDAYNNAFRPVGAPPRGGALFSCSHGVGRVDPATGAQVKGGLIELDAGRGFAGFRPVGTGVVGEDAYRPGVRGVLPAPPAGITITAHLHSCWSGRDPDAGGPETSVVTSLGPAGSLGAGNVTGHMDKAQVLIVFGFAAGGTPAQRAAAILAMEAAAAAAGFNPDPMNPGYDPVADWIASLPFSTAGNPANQYDVVQAVINAAVPGGAVTLRLSYSAPEAEFPDPPGEIARSGCVEPETIFVVNSSSDDDDGESGDGTCDTGGVRRGLTGICTLRAALNESDQTGALDAIFFNIPGAGVPTIRPEVIPRRKGVLGALRPVLIDGTTQPAGMVELDGSNTTPRDPADPDSVDPVGLELVGVGSTVKGLVINRFASDGIRIRPTGGPVGGNLIIRNLIGTNPTGTALLPNAGDGIRISGMTHNLVLHNIIAGNRQHGVHIEDFFGSAGNRNDVRGNSISDNRLAGVLIERDAVGNGVVANSIFSNGTLGIDLEAGGNDQQEAPIIILAVSSVGTTTVQGTLNSTPNRGFTIQFFTSQTCDSSEFGEGEALIGELEVTTNAGGNTNFNVSFPSSVATGAFITLTATGLNGTSEFSRCTALGVGVPPTPQNVDRLVTFETLPATFRTLSSTAGCPAGLVGTFTFDARLRNKSSSPTLSSLRVRVATLTGGNLVLNADAGPGGAGAVLTVPQTGGLADATLAPSEFVDVPFAICLATRAPFRFFVNVFGIPGAP